MSSLGGTRSCHSPDLLGARQLIILQLHLRLQLPSATLPPELNCRMDGGVIVVCICGLSLLNTVVIALDKCVCTAKQFKETWRSLIPAGPTCACSCTWLVSTRQCWPYAPWKNTACSYVCTYCEKTRLPGVNKQGEQVWSWMGLAGLPKSLRGGFWSKGWRGLGPWLTRPLVKGSLKASKASACSAKNTIELIEILKRISWGWKYATACCWENYFVV